MKLKIHDKFLGLLLVIISIFGCENSTEVNEKPTTTTQLIDDGDTNEADNNDGSNKEFTCKKVRKLGVYIKGEDNAYSVLVQDELKTYKGTISALDNYGYSSWSAHPVNGPLPRPYEGTFYLYENAQGIYFNYLFNIDDDGSSSNSVKVNIITIGNNKEDSLILSDDTGEVIANHSEDGTIYRSYFRYWSNTDGALIGPFNEEDFEIELDLLEEGDNKRFGIYAPIIGSMGKDNKTVHDKILFAPQSFKIKFHDVKHCEKVEKD